MPRSRRHVVPPCAVTLPMEVADRWLQLASSGWHVKVEDVAAAPDIMALVVADAAWGFNVEDWAARRPGRRRPLAQLRWRAEESVLVREQERLVAAAFEQRAPLIR